MAADTMCAVHLTAAVHHPPVILGPAQRGVIQVVKINGRVARLDEGPHAPVRMRRQRVDASLRCQGLKRRRLRGCLRCGRSELGWPAGARGGGQGLQLPWFEVVAEEGCLLLQRGKPASSGLQRHGCQRCRGSLLRSTARSTQHLHSTAPSRLQRVRHEMLAAIPKFPTHRV